MAYTINWVTKVITVPQTDLTLISGNNYSLNVDLAHDEIRRLEWEFPDGLWAEHAIEYINSQLLSGLVYSPIVKMVNDYMWFIDATNINVSLLGSNSNFLDTFLPGNGVSVLANNSAGKIVSGSGLDPSQDATLTQLGLDVDDIHKAHFLKRVWDKINLLTIYEADKTTPFKQFDTNDDLSDIDPQ